MKRAIKILAPAVLILVVNSRTQASITYVDVVDFSDAQLGSYLLASSADPHTNWYYRWSTGGRGWTYTFSPPGPQSALINCAALEIDASDLNGDEHNLIEGDQVVLISELDNGYSNQWHVTTYSHLDSCSMYKLMGGTTDIWMDTDSEHASLHRAVMLRSSTPTVDYEPVPARRPSVSQRWRRPCRIAKRTNDPMGLNDLNYALMGQ